MLQYLFLIKSYRQSDTIEGCKFHCEPVNSDHASRVCNESVPIIKTIRFCDISKLAKLMEEPNMDPKFIFLVRDPRGILNRYVSDSYGWESKQRNRLSGISFLERRIYNNPHIPNINAISGALFTLRIQY